MRCFVKYVFKIVILAVSLKNNNNKSLNLGQVDTFPNWALLTIDNNYIFCDRVTRNCTVVTYIYPFMPGMPFTLSPKRVKSWMYRYYFCYLSTSFRYFWKCCHQYQRWQGSRLLLMGHDRHGEWNVWGSLKENTRDMKVATGLLNKLNTQFLSSIRRRGIYVKYY